MVVSHDKVKKAFQYLLDTGKVHSQQDVADAIGKDKSYVSRHLNSPNGASDVFVRDLCKAFSGTFNLNYFLADEGDMLIAKEEKHEQPASMDNSMLLQIMQMFQERDRRISRLEDEVAELRKNMARLERAYHGYASIAADGGGITEKMGITK